MHSLYEREEKENITSLSELDSRAEATGHGAETERPLLAGSEQSQNRYYVGGGPRDAGLGGKTRYDHQVKGKLERYRRRSVRKNSSVVVDQRVSEPMQGAEAKPPADSRVLGIGGGLSARS
jgi:hypothetical protein